MNAGPDWSPDGEKLTFYSNRGGNYDIYVMNADGTNEARLTTKKTKDTMARWSPDGTQLVYVSELDGIRHLFLMNADGTKQRPFTSGPCACEDPTWRPDGKAIAYHRYCKDDPNKARSIYERNIDTQTETKLGQSSMREIQPAYSPTGDRIAFVGCDNDFSDANIFIMNANGSGLEQLTDSGLDFRPRWSPDSNKIVFRSKRLGNDDLFIMGISGAGRTRITMNKGGDAGGVFSPNGKTIAFASTLESGNYDIYLMRPFGNRVRRITFNDR